MAMIHRILKKPFFRNYEKEWRWPETVVKSGWTEVDIKSDSGSNLKAVLGLSSTEKILGAVVLAHPMRIDAKGFWLKNGHASMLREAGYHVLAFDFNGFGESASTTFDYPSDVIAAGVYIKNRYADLSLIVIGASFGAAWTVCAMARPDNPFSIAILEAAFPTLPDFWKRYPLPHWVLKASKKLYPAWERGLRPLLAAGSIKGHPDILLIYGTADDYTPPNHGRQLYDVLSQRAEVIFWEAEGAAHTKAYQNGPDLYRENVLGFMEKVLAKKD